MAVRKQKKKGIGLIGILAIITLILFILRFDAVTSIIDPDNKMKLSTFASDAFPIALGLSIIVLGIAVVASPWVGVALIAVGVGILASKAWSIWQRKKTSKDSLKTE